MSTRNLFSLSFAALLISPLPVIGDVGKPRAEARFIGDIGPHHRAWMKVEQVTNRVGNVVLRTNTAYVEIATGLNYRDATGEWRESNPSFDLSTDGYAVATRCQHRLIISANLNDPNGVIDLETPDGQRLRSSILGLNLFDPVSGNSLQVSTVRNSANIPSIIENLNYEAGRNPNNVSFITGLGWKRQREIVHQYARNDTRVLPPSGIPLGNIAAAFYESDLYYAGRLNSACYPPFTGNAASFALYDRWGDAFNIDREFIHIHPARGLATAALLANGTSAAGLPWQSASASIVVPNTAALNIPALVSLDTTLDLSSARIVWEAEGHEPHYGPAMTIGRSTPGPLRVEAEATLPDGRRVFASKNVLFNDPNGGSEFTPDANTIALYHFNSHYGNTLTPQSQTFPASPNNFVTFNNLIQGRSYRFTFGPNCTKLVSGSTTIFPGSAGTFVADSTTAQVWGNAGTSYDGMLKENLIQDFSGRGHHLTISGHATLTDNTAWMQSSPAGAKAVRFSNVGDELKVTIPYGEVYPGSGTTLTIDFRIYPRAYKGEGQRIVRLQQIDQTDAQWTVRLPNSWDLPVGVPHRPQVLGPSAVMLDSQNWDAHVALHTWHNFRITLDSSGVSRLFIGNLASPIAVSSPPPVFRQINWLLSLGNFDGDIDELKISH